ncbi:NUDIX hydrolase [Actinomadura sp. DC4]|uniref:NUDIX domain-containing protein n=1 Tax=Actinomadura sp. DC4 TaxID=3055069 RepID=UPI0025AFE674|nr:NUDIX hydrolase [Actinomadura sp. DC4]MDN3358233.1 NUDIX hydrolase [Actinomadura sp. DC4]
MSSDGSAALPVAEYLASLPRKRMGAGALFRDAAGRVLLVEPTYKPTWEIPGGIVEAEESPTAACRREVAEELGLDRPARRVLAVDWVSSRPGRPEGLMLVYDGGVLTEAEIAAIRLPADELASYAFLAPDRVPGAAGEVLARRIAACLEAIATGVPASLEDGHAVT